MHEDFYSYKHCAQRERNKGLFTSDQVSAESCLVVLTFRSGEIYRPCNRPQRNGTLFKSAVNALVTYDDSQLANGQQQPLQLMLLTNDAETVFAVLAEAFHSSVVLSGGVFLRLKYTVLDYIFRKTLRYVFAF